MKIEGASFNEEWMKTKSEAEFIEHEKHGPLSVKQLREAYRLVVPKPKTDYPKPLQSEDKEEEQAQ